MNSLKDRLINEAVSPIVIELVNGINELAEIALNKTSGNEQTRVRDLQIKLVELANKKK